MANPRLRIKELRQARGLTLADFAQIVGVSKSYLSEIENGRKTVNARRLQRFAEILGCEISDIFDPGDGDAESMSVLTLYSQLNREADRALVRGLIDRLILAQSADDAGDT